MPNEQGTLFHYRESADVQDLDTAFHQKPAEKLAGHLESPVHLDYVTLRSLKPTSLMHNIAPEVMKPIFKRCSNYWKSVKHQHQPLEGNTKNHGSRTKLAQIHILLRFLKVKPLDHEVFLLEDILDSFTDDDVSSIRSDLDQSHSEYSMTSSGTKATIQDLPFNNQVDPLFINDPEVLKLQQAMKQFPQQTELDLEVHHTSDSRLYAINHGARRLRYLCIPHTPYKKCVMCCRTIGINYPLTTPPDDACGFLWQVNVPSRIWALPAHRCDWSAYTPA